MSGAHSFYTNSSYGQFGLTTTINSTVALGASTSYSNQWHLAQAAFAAAGKSTNSYDYWIIMNASGVFGNQATLGGQGCWVSGINADNVVHELSHNLGLFHANLWMAYGDTVFWDQGKARQYANLFDPMGGTIPGDLYQRDFSLSSKVVLGWLDSGNLHSNPSAGTYTIYGLDRYTNSTKKVGLLFNGTGTNKWWVEYRANSGKTLINRNGTDLVDMNPNTMWSTDHADAWLREGRTFSDYTNAIHITTLRADTNKVDLLVVRTNSTTPITASISTSFDEFGTFTFVATPGYHYSWDMGDNLLHWFGDTNRVTFNFAFSGFYTVTCWVSDGAGQQKILVERVGDDPSPAYVGLGGYIRDGNSNAIAGARVSLGANRWTYSDPNGYYHFGDLTTNGVYQLNPSKAWYNLTPQSAVVMLSNLTTTVNFTAHATNAPNNPPYIFSLGPFGTYFEHSTVPFTIFVYDEGLIQLTSFWTDGYEFAVNGLANIDSLNRPYFTASWVEPDAGEWYVNTSAQDNLGKTGYGIPRYVYVNGTNTVISKVICTTNSNTIRIKGIQNQYVAVQVSTNLINWSQIDYFYNPAGVTNKTYSTTLPRRFYRLQLY